MSQPPEPRQIASGSVGSCLKCRNDFVQSCVHQQEKKNNAPLKVAVAGLAAVMLMAAHSPAALADDDSLRKKICAAQPTAKICLAGSAKSK